MYQKYSDRIQEQYKQEIENWNWNFIRIEAREYPQESFYDEEEYFSCYLGSILNIYPSGKYYLPFACSNLDRCEHCRGKGYFGKIRCIKCNGYGSSEAFLDELFAEALEEVSSDHGFWIESGDGCSTDLFACFKEDNDE